MTTCRLACRSTRYSILPPLMSVTALPTSLVTVPVFGFGRCVELLGVDERSCLHISLASLGHVVLLQWCWRTPWWRPPTYEQCGIARALAPAMWHCCGSNHSDATLLFLDCDAHRTRGA